MGLFTWIRDGVKRAIIDGFDDAERELTGRSHEPNTVQTTVIEQSRGGPAIEVTNGTGEDLEPTEARSNGHAPAVVGTRRRRN